ncbi:hypothetical protein PP175_20825 [Aneurinibacillus sp. Ricciae_BoGa-3]|nr:hypothetical protein [Aneurinibacillus sp. Ricciae_BoGa-3]WCK56884.1 hypothetical protein PP175_20825 [Aneurinibacillus sp. Ricciae_BoGa-3]
MSGHAPAEKHPIFGHTLSNERLPFHVNPLSLHGPLVHLKGTIKKVEPDVTFHGTSHYHLIINHIELISIKGADPSIVTDECFCAIRYGDKLGLGQPIEGLAEGQLIELQGEYIDKNHAYPSLGNPGDPVLHFTHHPVGFVIYKGKRYE